MRCNRWLSWWKAGCGVVMLLTGAPGSVSSAASFWIPLGPYGGVVNALAISPGSPSTVLAGTSGGGVFRSVDGAAYWVPSNHGLPPMALVRSLAFAPSDPTRAYAVVGYSSSSTGMFLSFGAGETWTQQGTDLPQGSGPLAIDPSDRDKLYLGTADGVLVSSDHGVSWRSAASGLPPNEQVTALAVSPSEPGELFAGVGSKGVFKSLDAGTTWTLVFTASSCGGFGGGLCTVFAIAIDPNASEIVYVGGEGSNQLWKSVDGGNTWTPSSVSGGYTTGERIQVIAIAPSSRTTIYVAESRGISSKATARVFLSLDGASTWNWWSGDIPLYSDVSSLAIDPRDPHTVYAGLSSGEGVFKVTSYDGGHWQPVNHGLTATTVGALAVVQSDAPAILAGTYGGGVFKAACGGGRCGSYLGTWTSNDTNLQLLEVHALATDPQDARTVYAGTGTSYYGSKNHGGVFKSTNAGDTWTAAVDPSAFNAYWIAVDPINPLNVFSADGENVRWSSDGGAHWSSPWTDGLPSDPGISGLVLNAAAPVTLFVACKTAGVFKTTGWGVPWQKTSSGLTGLEIVALAADPSDSNTYYVGTRGGHGVFRTRDGGLTWNPTTTTQWATGGVNVLLVDHTNRNTIYAATETDVFWSGDGGLAWQPLAAGLSGLEVLSLALTDTDPQALYVGTYGNGSFSVTGLPTPPVHRVRRHLHPQGP